MEEIQLYLEEAKSLMDKAVQHTIAELIKIRAGKAMPNFLDGIMVVYYGNPTPLQHPQNNGEMVLLTVPPLTEERRKNLVKQVKNECENGKISIRNVRKDTNDGLRKLQKEGVAEDDVKRAEDTVQKMTDQHSAKIDELYAKKEAEIMTI